MNIKSRYGYGLVDLLTDAFILGGSFLVAYGAWLAWVPSGFMVGGLLLLGFGLRGSQR